MAVRALLIMSLFTATTLPVWSQECDPNYDPCVPVASDVDCAGGIRERPGHSHRN